MKIDICDICKEIIKPKSKYTLYTFSEQDNIPESFYKDIDNYISSNFKYAKKYEIDENCRKILSHLLTLRKQDIETLNKEIEKTYKSETNSSSNVNFFELFTMLTEDQFKYGGVKYASSEENKESTDILFDDFGYTWLLGQLAKYCLRYKNVKRNKDILKISCYCYIIWLKRGFHEVNGGTQFIINTNIDLKNKNYPKFIALAKEYNQVYAKTHKDYLQYVYNSLKSMVYKGFNQIAEWEILEIFTCMYRLWLVDIPNDEKLNDCDTWNKTDKK